MPMAVVYATVNGRLVEANRGGTITKYVSDTLGSVVQTRSSSGAVTSTTEYWPYGEVRTSTGTNPSPWGFVGTLGYFIDAAFRLYVRARMYRPREGRWNKEDPLWPDEPGYAYCRFAPASLSHATGLSVGPKQCGVLPKVDKDAQELLNKYLKCVQECFLKNPDKFKGCFKKCLGTVSWDKLKDCVIEAICCLNAGLLADMRDGQGQFGYDPCAGGEKYNQVACCDLHFCIAFAKAKKTYQGRPMPLTTFSESAHDAPGKCGCSSYTGPSKDANSECNETSPPCI